MAGIKFHGRISAECPKASFANVLPSKINSFDPAREIPPQDHSSVGPLKHLNWAISEKNIRVVEELTFSKSPPPEILRQNPPSGKFQEFPPEKGGGSVEVCFSKKRQI